jgi:hypothetical protein
MASKICGKTRAAGSRIIAPRRSGSTHLHRPWRPSIRQSTTACPDGGVFRAVTSGTATMRRLQRVPLPACRAGIASITVFPGLSVGRNDRPQNGIVNAKVLVTDTVADRFDLAPWLGRKVREPVVWNAPHSLRYGLDRLASCATNYRIFRKVSRVVRASMSCKTAISARQSRIAMVGSFGITRPGWRLARYFPS